MNYHWNWGVFFAQAAQNQTYLGWLLAGLKATLLLGLFSWIIALLVGSMLGALRTLPNKWLSRLATAYVELFRNIPLILQLFIWYFVVPELVPGGGYIKSMNPSMAMFLCSVLCLGTYTAARVCEQVRAGINALSHAQRHAGLAMGLTLAQTYRFVLLPMCFRIIVPPLTSEFLNVFKNSAVASTIGLLELAAQGRQLVDYTAQPYESFIAVTVAYMLINLTVMTLMRFVDNRTKLPGFAGGK